MLLRFMLSLIDFFKETKEHQTKLIEKLEELIEVTEESGGGGGTGIGLDDLVGRRGGARPSGGGGGGTAGKVLKTAKTAAVTAAVVAGGGYVVDAGSRVPLVLVKIKMVI